MASNHLWSETISSIQRDRPLNRQHGFAQLVDGRLIYSPNSNRKIAILPSISDPKDLKNYVSYVQTPFWWNSRLAYLPFIPLDPWYTNSVPFQDLAFIPRQFTSSAEGKHMLPDMQSKWERLENALTKATHTLLSRFNVQGDPPPLPSSLGYKGAHLLVRHLRTALATSRDSFSLWIGALAFAIALSDFMEPRKNGAIPAWYLALRDAGLDEMWVDGVRTSPMMRFDANTLRVGVIMDILSPQGIQASVDWLCNFHVPVWYPWGTREATAASLVPDIARLAPHGYQLQNLSSSFFTKEVRDTYQETKHDSQPRVNKRPFEATGNDVQMSKRPRQELQASNAPDPWGASSGAITWTTDEPNPWGNGNWPVFPKPNHPTTSDSAQERLMPQPQPSLTRNVASYEPFFARRKERNERLRKSECAKDRQRRENRERIPPTNKALMFEWVKGDDDLYTRVRVTKSEYEDCFERHGKYQRRYDAFANEWDMCEDFGPLDERQIAENAEEDEESDVLRVTVARDQAIVLQMMGLSPTPDFEMQATNSNMDLPSNLISQSDPDPSILDSSGGQGTSVPHTVGETEGPSPRTDEAASLSLVETSPATSVEPQVDPSVPFSGDVCYQDPTDVSKKGLLPTPEWTSQPIAFQLDSSVGDGGTSVSHIVSEAEGLSQNTNEAEAPPALSDMPTIPQVNPLVPFSEVKAELDFSASDGGISVSHTVGGTEGPLQNTDEAEALPAMSIVPTIPQVEPLVPFSVVKDQVVVSQDEDVQDKGPLEICQGPDSIFSWPVSSSLMALVAVSDERRCTLETYNTTSILHSVYGFICPNPRPAAPITEGPIKKKLQVSVGLDKDEVEFLQSPLVHPALEFLDCLADAQLSPSAESSDLAEGSLRPLRNAERLRQLRVVGSLYVFNFKSDATLPWMIGVASAAIALYIVRLDPEFNDYEISRHLLHCGIAFHTLLPLRKVPKSPIPDTYFISFRSAGYVFTIKDFNDYIHRRDSLLRSPRGRAALLKGGIVWRLAVETIGVDECLEGPSIETNVHRRGLVHPTADSNIDLCDDDLSPAELDLICGVYECSTGRLLSLNAFSLFFEFFLGIPNQTSLKSWFPLHNTWSVAAPLYFWADRNHSEFERRLAEIWGGGQPLTATQWSQKMKASSHSRRLKAHNETESKRFIEKALTRPH